jgi:spore coat polysaccharide biosynthesis protein SpsF
MNPTCIIQARMGSTRLPGKTLKIIAGKTVLARVVERVRMASEIEQIVVATSDQEQDDVIVAACDEMGVDWSRGSEDNVLKRYLGAAEHFKADPIIRVTADCPLIDPGVLNALVRTYKDNPGFFVTNNLEHTFPHGLDAEVFSLDMLREAAKHGPDEHVTQWMRAQPNVINLRSPANLSNIRVTLDTRDDLTAIRAIYRSFPEREYISTADVLWLVQHRPELAELVVKERAA